MMLRAADFAGVWQLDRQIEDRRAGGQAHMTGMASLSQNGVDALIYKEVGQLRIAGGAPFEARRQYLWQFAGDRVAVRFKDGTAFHTFAPAGQGAGTDHPCGEDYYHVTYDFTRWPQWQARWEVRGPRKDYASVSVYIRPDHANSLAENDMNGQ